MRARGEPGEESPARSDLADGSPAEGTHPFRFIERSALNRGFHAPPGGLGRFPPVGCSPEVATAGVVETSWLEASHDRSWRSAKYDELALGMHRWVLYISLGVRQRRPLPTCGLMLTSNCAGCAVIQVFGRSSLIYGSVIYK